MIILEQLIYDKILVNYDKILVKRASQPLILYFSFLFFCFFFVNSQCGKIVIHSYPLIFLTLEALSQSLRIFWFIYYL